MNRIIGILTLAFSTSCTSQEQWELMNEAGRTPGLPPVQFSLGPVGLSGTVVWFAEVTNESLADKLTVSASGTDSLGRRHRVSGDIVLPVQGERINGSLAFNTRANLRGTIGTLRHVSTQVTAQGQETLVDEGLIPVEFNLRITESGTKLSGGVTVHPNAPSLFSSGRSAQRESSFSFTGPILARSCTVLAVVTPSVPGEPSREVVVAESHPLCSARFLVP